MPVVAFGLKKQNNVKAEAEKEVTEVNVVNAPKEAEVAKDATLKNQAALVHHQEHLAQTLVVAVLKKGSKEEEALEDQEEAVKQLLLFTKKPSLI